MSFNQLDRPWKGLGRTEFDNSGPIRFWVDLFYSWDEIGLTITQTELPKMHPRNYPMRFT